MNDKKLKVVWICHFSDTRIRSYIKFCRFYYIDLINFIKRRPLTQRNDYAVWVTNAISEFEHYDDIDLTVIFPHYAIKRNFQKFSVNGVHYICFRSEDDRLRTLLRQRLFNKEERKFFRNRYLIKKMLRQICPDVVHVIGAENPYYSISALDIPINIPSIVSLQTLMSDPDFLNNYPICKDEYEYRSGIERAVIRKCNYVASSVPRFKEIVLKDICPDAVFLNLTLAVGQEVNITQVKKEYDFVYFAADISKAADMAIEAFALASIKKPGISLNISGYYDKNYKLTLDKRIEELGIKDQVFFTGLQATHTDVLSQIKKSKVALLPLKVDMISGTIREAMACGIPVVTTITPATPDLNESRESVLLSEKGDYVAMAENMIKILNDKVLYDLLKRNGIETIQEKYSNSAFMKKWRKAYFEVVSNFKDGIPLSEDIHSFFC